MSTHDEDFWGDQAEWKPSGNVARIDADRTRPIDVVRKGWKNLLGSGANPTREHGIVRPDVSGLDTRRADVLGDPTPMVSVRPDMFDDLDDDLPLDAFSYANASDNAIQIPPASYTDVDDLGSDDAVAQIADDAWDAEFDVAPRRTAVGVDPLLARLGTMAVVAALLVPVFMSATSGDGADIIESAVTAEAQGQAIQPLPQTSALGDTAATMPDSQVPVVAAPVDNAAEVFGQTAGDTAAAATDAPAATERATTEPATTARATAESATTESATTRVDEQATATATGASSINDSAEADTPAERVARVCAIDYEIVPGDFWIRIADGAGVPLAELLKANGVSASTPMYAGDSICLPAGSSIPSPPAETTTTAAPTTTAATTTTVAPTTTAATTTTVPASSGDVQQIIRNVWPDELEDQALEVAFRESRYVPTAKNFCCYGIFQIYWDVHKSWLDDIGITSAQQLYDPEMNARAAYALYQRAGGWGPWSL